jgi:hypothetical protein
MAEFYASGGAGVGGMGGESPAATAPTEKEGFEPSTEVNPL